MFGVAAPSWCEHPEIKMRFLLFYKIDVTDRHPVATLVVGALAAYAFAWCVHAMGWL
jgi:hypothetical protein